RGRAFFGRRAADGRRYWGWWNGLRGEGLDLAVAGAVAGVAARRTAGVPAAPVRPGIAAHARAVVARIVGAVGRPVGAVGIGAVRVGAVRIGACQIRAMLVEAGLGL